MSTLTLAVPAAPDEIPDSMPRFLGALSARAGHDVRLLAVPSYAGLAAVMESGQADLVWAPPVVALELSSWGTAQPVAAVVRGGRLTYPAVLVAHAEGPIRGLDDIVACRMAFTSKLSAAGYVVPRLFLEASGLSPERAFREEVFLRSHTLALDAVASGRVDIAASYARHQRISSRLLLPHPSPSLRVVAVTGLVPSDVVCASERLSITTADEIGHGLSRMLPSELSPLSAFLDVERFVMVDASHVSALRALVARARRSSAAPVAASLGQ